MELLRLPTVDDWFQLALRYPQYHQPSHTLLKDFGYMEIMNYLDSTEAVRILEFGHGWSSVLFERYGRDREVWGVDDFQGLGYLVADTREAWEAKFDRKIRSKAPGCIYRRGL